MPDVSTKAATSATLTTSRYTYRLICSVLQLEWSRTQTLQRPWESEQSIQKNVFCTRTREIQGLPALLQTSLSKTMSQRHRTNTRHTSDAQCLFPCKQETLREPVIHAWTEMEHHSIIIAKGMRSQRTQDGLPVISNAAHTGVANKYTCMH
jgi:hypothetical protein